jgi:hypothetical protein
MLGRRFNHYEKIFDVHLNKKDLWMPEDCIQFISIEKNNFVDTQTFDYIEIVSELPPVHQWHDEGCSIQIIQTISDCLKMLRVYPAMAQYKLDNNIEDVEEFGFIYFYVNELFQQHREILMDISGEGRWTSIINEK